MKFLQQMEKPLLLLLPKVEEKKESTSPSPAGVNRRTAVLFSKKARKHEQTTATKTTPVSRRGKGKILEVIHKQLQ